MLLPIFQQKYLLIWKVKIHIYLIYIYIYIYIERERERERERVIQLHFTLIFEVPKLPTRVQMSSTMQSSAPASLNTANQIPTTILRYSHVSSPNQFLAFDKPTIFVTSSS